MRTQWSFSDADFGLRISFSSVELHSGKMKGEEENHFFSKSGKKKKKKNCGLIATKSQRPLMCIVL